MKSAASKAASKSGEPKRVALSDRPDDKADAKSPSGGAAAAEAKPIDAPEEDLVEFDEPDHAGTESPSQDQLFNYASARIDYQRLHRILQPQLYLDLLEIINYADY